MLITDLSAPTSGAELLGICLGWMIYHLNQDMILARTPTSDVLINIKRSSEFQPRKWTGATPGSQLLFFSPQRQKVICKALQDTAEYCARAAVRSEKGCPRAGPQPPSHMHSLDSLAVLLKRLKGGESESWAALSRWGSYLESGLLLRTSLVPYYSVLLMVLFSQTWNYCVKWENGRS